MKREAKFTSLYDLHITFTFLCYFSAMKAGFDCMGQVNCFVRKGTGTILSPLPPLNLGKCLAEGEVTVKIASIIKIDIWFESRTPPLVAYFLRMNLFDKCILQFLLRIADVKS